MGIKNNIANFHEVLRPYPAKLVAVSKTHPASTILEAYESGQRLFGENKVQELAEKQAKLPSEIEWHLIGHLQRNKVKQVAPFVSLIHSVDSLRLLEEIDKQGKKVGRIIPCLLQVYIAREETKFGLSSEELAEIMESPITATLKNVRIEGFMGMATLTEAVDQIRGEFRYLKELFEKWRAKRLPPNIQLKELSMGMSSDFRIALEEGSTLVRVGTAIFGARNSSPPDNP